MSAAMRQGGEGVVPPPKGGGDPFDLGAAKGTIGKMPKAPKTSKAPTYPKAPRAPRAPQMPKFK